MGKHAILAMFTLISASFITPTLAQSCGSNAGWLPWKTRSSAPSYISDGSKQTLTQYDHCGASREVTAESNSATWFSCDNTNGATGWQPARNTVCKNQTFTETCSRWSKERLVYGSSLGSNWLPSRDDVCDTEQFTQTSNCGFTRVRSGLKNCCGGWSPAKNTICINEPFIQTSNCGDTREVVGTKNCCSAENWTPAPSSICTGLPFQQTNSCGDIRAATGSGGSCISEDDSQLHLNQGDFPHDPKIARLTSLDLIASNPNASNTAKLYSRKMPDDRSGVFVDYPIVVSGQNLPSHSRIPMFTRGADFSSFLSIKAENSMLNNPQAGDQVSFCLDTDIAPSIAEGTCIDSAPRDTSCGEKTILQNCRCEFNTKGKLYPLCDECEGANLTRTVSYSNQSNVWTGADPATVCTGSSAVQTNECGDTRTVAGTRNCAGAEEGEPEWYFSREEAITVTPDIKPTPINRLCAKFRNGSFGYDKYRKVLRYDNRNTGESWACTHDQIGTTDYCYDDLSSEGNPNNVQFAKKVFFLCRN